MRKKQSTTSGLFIFSYINLLIVRLLAQVGTFLFSNGVAVIS